MRKPKQVVALRERREPVGRRLTREREHDAAIPEKKDSSVRGGGACRRLETKPDSTVVVVTVTRRTAVAEVRVGTVSSGLATKYSVFSEAIRAGNESHRKNEQYV